MGKNVFSVPIFFIVFRETLEAAIIVSVLLGLVEQIANDDGSLSATTTVAGPISEKREGSPDRREGSEGELAEQPVLDSEVNAEDRRKRFIRRMRWQIFAGSILGLLIALAIGAAFIAVWFTKASNLWAKSEELWEGMRLPVGVPRGIRLMTRSTGVFELIACIMIFVMGVTMLKMDRAKAKWRVKLQKAFEGQRTYRGFVVRH